MNLFEIGEKIETVKMFECSGVICLPGEIQPSNNYKEFINIVKYLNNNKLYNFGSNLFLRACEHDNIELAQLCVDMGFDINDYDFIGRNGIFIHCNGAHVPISYNFVKYLIDVGVYVDQFVASLYENDISFETEDERKTCDLIRSSMVTTVEKPVRLLNQGYFVSDE